MQSHETLVAPAGDGAPAGPRIVLFDFDGVLSHGDAFGQLVRERYRRSLWRAPLALLALPWLLALLLARRRLPRRTLVHIALLGLGERGYRRVAERYADYLARRPRQFLRDGLLALRRHQTAGDRVIVVTGCEQLLVCRLLDQLGLVNIEVLASTLKPGLLGMRLRQHNIGAGKVRALAGQGIATCTLAYGDSLYDLPMFGAATEAVLVNGTPKLCKRIEQALGRSVQRVQWY